MDVYEHGIEADKDEWQGALRVIATNGLPIYAGFNRTIVDFDGLSLNERAARLARVNGPHRTSDFFEESDLRHCTLGMLYHVNRIIDLYVLWTQRMEQHKPFGTAVCAKTGDPHVAYELDAFMASSRRIYEFLRKVLWKHYGKGSDSRWRSIKAALCAKEIPASFAEQLQGSWQQYGSKLAAYRDCLTHNELITADGTPCDLEWYGKRWGMTVKLPANPEGKSKAAFNYEAGPDALLYCHEVGCHLVSLCESVLGLEKVHHNLNNPTQV